MFRILLKRYISSRDGGNSSTKKHLRRGLDFKFPTHPSNPKRLCNSSTQEAKSSTKSISRVRAMAKSKRWNVSPSRIGVVSDLQNMQESRTISWQVGTLRQSNLARFLSKAPIVREQPLPWRDKALFFLTACQQRQQNCQFGHLPSSSVAKAQEKKWGKRKSRHKKGKRWQKGKIVLVITDE